LKATYKNRIEIHFVLLLAFAFFLSGCCNCLKSPSIELKGNGINHSQDRYAPGELLIKFESEVQEQEIGEFLALYGFTVIKKIEGQEVYQVKIPGNQSVMDMAKTLSKDSRIRYAEPNYIRSVH